MKKIFLVLLAAIFAFSASAEIKAPHIIANGGYHKSPASGAKNTMSALKAAQKLKIYGSECDINLTKDNELVVVNHGKHPNGKIKPNVDAQRATLEKLLAIPHANGEKVCTIEDYLARVAKKPTTKLIIELKGQDSIERENTLIEKTLAAVEKAGLQGNVEYISFRPWICFELAKKAPKGTSIAYLDGKYTPEYVKGMGCTGIDFNINTLRKKSSLIKAAHKLGLTVNVWTVNKEADIRWCITNGVDFITTDEPALAKQIVKEMCK